uniref:Uncharacterized protein n=1 Tax=Amazona collaria TaxID=241587 RepID=A0A8B9FN98_9PSIT
MGKGQHRMPSKDELVQRYNRMNTIPQTRSIQSRFLQSRNLNCIALCEGAVIRGGRQDGGTGSTHTPGWVEEGGSSVPSLGRQPLPLQSSPPRTCRSTATSGSAPSRTTSAPASSLCTKTAKWEMPISILRTPKSRRRSCV